MRHHAAAPALLSAAVTAAVGCTYPSLPRRSIEIRDTAVTVNLDLDLLFLIDDSPSMRDKQLNLAANFPEFINALDRVVGGRPNVHIGVVTTDLGTKGTEDPAPGQGIGTLGRGGCSGLGKNGELQTTGALLSGAPFIRDVRDAQTDGARSTNYSGSLADVFATMANVGDGGCGFEQQLEAIRKALDNNLENAGFLRPDAYLGIIIITDEDDCSITHSSLLAITSEADATLGPPQSFRCTRFGVLCEEGGTTSDSMNAPGPKGACRPAESSAYLAKVGDYADFLKGLKSDPGKVFVAGIMGPSAPFVVELRAPVPGGEQVPALAHSCTYVGGDGLAEVADPPARIRAFLDEFPQRNVFVPICDRDLSAGLRQIGDGLRIVIDNACFENPLADVDARTPGPQYDCTVSVVTTQAETELARCAPEDASAGNLPCWRLESDAANCPNLDHIAFKIEGRALLPRDAHVIAKCVVEVAEVAAVDRETRAASAR